MKRCTYCGRDHPDEATTCSLDQQPLEFIVSPLATTAAPVIERAPSPPNKFFLALRRIFSFIIGSLMFMVVAPEFVGMPRGWIVFWVLFPLAPVLCVCFGAGRNRIVEGFGWLMHFIGVVMFLLTMRCVAAKKKSWIWFIPRFEFSLQGIPGVLEVRVWPWFTIRSMRLVIADQISYEEGHHKVAA